MVLVKERQTEFRREEPLLADDAEVLRGYASGAD